MIESESWQERTRESAKAITDDPIVSKLLKGSNVTAAQFETLMIDQLGHDMANKRLTRIEMAQIMRKRNGISRGALNRTLKQARVNVSEAIYTILLLGYSGVLGSPSLIPFVDVSEQLRSQTAELRESTGHKKELYSASVEKLLQNIDEAFDALHGRKRDV